MLHNDKKELSIWVSHSVEMSENYGNMEISLAFLKYRFVKKVSALLVYSLLRFN